MEAGLQQTLGRSQLKQAIVQSLLQHIMQNAEHSTSGS